MKEEPKYEGAFQVKGIHTAQIIMGFFWPQPVKEPDPWRSQLLSPGDKSNRQEGREGRFHDIHPLGSIMELPKE